MLNLIDFFTNIHDLYHRVLPKIKKYSDRLVYEYVFMSTTAEGESEFKGTQDQISRKLNLSLHTIWTSIRWLEKEGYIIIREQGKGRSPGVYAINWPPTPDKMITTDNDARLTLTKYGIVSDIQRILDSLTKEEAESFETTKQSMTAEERRSISEQAARETKPGESVQDSLNRTILQTLFGPARLREIRARING